MISGMTGSEQTGSMPEHCPPKAKVGRSNRLGRATSRIAVPYSALMPAISITFAHFGISVWMRLENSSGVVSIISKPSDASF